LKVLEIDFLKRFTPDRAGGAYDAYADKSASLI